MYSVAFENETPQILRRQGLTVAEVVDRQAHLLLTGRSLWDYVSWAFLHDLPLHPTLVDSSELLEIEKSEPVVEPEPPKPVKRIFNAKPWSIRKKKRQELMASNNPAKQLLHTMDLPLNIDVDPYLVQLSKFDRELIEEYYITGEDRVVIAQRHGWKMGTLRGNVYKATGRLREILRKEGVIND